jgi:hypothetical protein
MTPRWFRRRRRPCLTPSPGRTRYAPSPALVDAVAAAIAQTAGMNWHTPLMLPAYRAEFRRQAAAAIDAFRASS